MRQSPSSEKYSLLCIDLPGNAARNRQPSSIRCCAEVVDVALAICSKTVAGITIPQHSPDAFFVVYFGLVDLVEQFFKNAIANLAIDAPSYVGFDAGEYAPNLEWTRA